MNSTNATWLDLALMPGADRARYELRIHPVSADCGECYVLTLNGRMVRAGDGRLTVFRSRDAVDRFLALLELDSPESGEHAGWLPGSSYGEHCLKMCGSTLCACNFDEEARAKAPDAQLSRRARASVRPSSSAMA